MTTDMGTRDRQVRVMRLPGTESGWGQPTPGPRVEFKKIWVGIKNQSGMAMVRAAQPVSVVRVSLRGNYRTDVRASDELWHGDVHYKIVAILPDEVDREFTDYVCEVINGTGTV